MPPKRQRKGRKPSTNSASVDSGASTSQSRPQGNNSGTLRKHRLMDIATTTLKAVEAGSYTLDGIEYDISDLVKRTNDSTELHPAGDDENPAPLSSWRQHPTSTQLNTTTRVQTSVVEVSTLEGARTLYDSLEPDEQGNRSVGVLAFASAKNPGGGFLNGAQAQEESLARSSSLYPSLMTPAGQSFYNSHRKNPRMGYYSHAMIYSPGVILLRDDDGAWKTPIGVDMLTSCAVNAGVARREIHDGDESQIESTMEERMGRILYLFEQKGVRNLVLGSFGTGVFRNKVEVVAKIWAELLIQKGSKPGRFAHSFDRVVFAILGRPTFLTFKTVFAQYIALPPPEDSG